VAFVMMLLVGLACVLSRKSQFKWAIPVVVVVLAGVFFKCGGLNRHPVKGYCFAALSHFIYDAVVFTLVLATG